MSEQSSPPSDGAERSVPGQWIFCLVMGGLATVVGLLLLTHPFEAVRTLALLAALSVALQGVDLIADASRSEPRWPGSVLGIAHLVVAVLALTWPGITLWALAVLVGIGFVTTGVATAVSPWRVHPSGAHRAALLVVGASTVAAGVLALAWPGATIVVLAVLFGAHTLVQGLTLLVLAARLRREPALAGIAP